MYLKAANGAKARSIIGLLDECRGVSWAIGCESDLSASVTFASILHKKHYYNYIYQFIYKLFFLIKPS